MNSLQLAILLMPGILALYILNCLYARGVKKINVKLATYYIATMAMLGVLGELIIDSTYSHIIGKPLWVYRVLPVHDAYTSIFSLFIWGAMGFQIYLIHDTLSVKKLPSLYKLALVFCIEAIILEVLFNLLSLAIFGKYVYYYLPNDLWHITSFQVFPLYLLTGYIYVYILTRFKHRNYQISLVFSTIALATIFVS